MKNSFKIFGQATAAIGMIYVNTITTTIAAVATMKPYLKFFLTFLVLSLFLIRPGYSQTLEDIRTLISNQNYELALSEIDSALKKDKKNEQLDLYKGYTLVQLERYVDGIKWYKKLIKRWQDNPEPINNLGVIYRLQGKFSLAIETFNTAIEKFPDYAFAYENLGDTYIQLAEQSFTKGLKKEPNAMLRMKAQLSSNFHNLAVNTISQQQQEDLATQAEQQALQQAEQSAQQQADATAAAEQKAAQQQTEIEQTGEVVMAALRSWVNGWSSLEPDKYLAHYSKDFTPDRGLTLETWTAKKKRIISNAGFIDIKLDDISIEFPDENNAVATFTQSYESNSVKSVDRKELVMQLQPEGWLIVSERGLN